MPLPWLDRPLGAVIKPLTSGVARTPSERTEAYLASGRMEERKQIVKTATRGYFYDFHSLRSHGGKTWMAPSTMIRSDRSLWFPTVQGTCLADKKTRDTAELFRGKVSVVCILNSRISEVSPRGGGRRCLSEWGASFSTASPSRARQSHGRHASTQKLIDVLTSSPHTRSLPLPTHTRPLHLASRSPFQTQEHTKSFYQPTLDLHGDNNSFQLVQVNLQPNLLKHYLISLFLSSLRSQIPPKLHKTYFLSKLDPQAVVTNLVEDPSGNNPPLSTSTTRGEELGIHNKHVGYTYLVDPDGKIRWAGCGFAEGEEREALLNCTSLLLDRVGGRK